MNRKVLFIGIYIILVLGVTIGSIYLFFYSQKATSTTNVTTAKYLSPQKVENPPTTVEVKQSPLNDITKAQVAALVAKDGPQTINIAQPILPAGVPVNFLPSQNQNTVQFEGNATVIAGNFKDASGSDAIILTKGSKEQRIYGNQFSRLILKESDKQQIVSQPLLTLIQQKSLAIYVQPGDLILSMYVYNENDKLQANWFVVFK